MKNIKIPKIFTCIIAITSFFILNMGVIAYARDTDWNSGRTFSWSPYISNVNAYQSVLGIMEADIDFYFDSTGASENNSIYYFTMEENNVNDGLGEWGQYSNIPNPHFDWDDDNDDGYCEESEVVTNGTLTANSKYYFFTEWSNMSSSDKSGSVNFIAQRSVWNPLNGEYEGYHYDLLANDFYTVSPY